MADCALMNQLEKSAPSSLISRGLRSALIVAISTLTPLSQTSCASILNRDPNLRWWAFKTYGADRICPEMLKTSVPLKMQDASPTIGRYFPSSCTFSINETNRTVVVNIGGSGYAYLPTSKLSSFTMTATVEYAFDFYMHDDGAWVWGKMARIAAGPDFRMTNSQNPIVDLATGLTPAGSAANIFGGQVVSRFISRGFTVVETDEGKEFALGYLPAGRFPFRPVEVDEEDEAYTFQNDVADIYNQQMDFLGPFEVADDDQVIQLRGTLSGANAVDFLVVPKMTGDIWREGYQAGRAPGPPPGTFISSSVVQPGPFVRRFALNPGLYYVVVDNSAGVGQAAPGFALPGPLYDPSVRMTYLAQLVED
jgi:hypothetical protein